MATAEKAKAATHDVWHSIGPTGAAAVCLVAVLAPILLTGYSYIATSGFYIPMGFGTVTGVAFMAIMHFMSAHRSASRQSKASVVAEMSRLDRPKVETLLQEKELPSWISYPEFEKVDWLNTELKEVWPYLNKASCAMLIDVLTPTLEAYKIGIIRGMKVQSVTLGNTGPRISGVRSYRSGDDEVTLETRLDWRQGRDQKLVIAVETALGPKIGIKISDIRLYGVLKLVLKPLMGEIPGFGAVLFSLADPPEIAMDIGILGGDITALPGIEKMIDNIIKTAVNDMLVWPSRMVFPVVAGDFSYLELRPVGYLDIVLIEGKDIPKTDVFGKSDPFVFLYVRQKEGAIKRSSVKMNNLAPVWNESFFIEVEDVQTQFLTIRLMDDEYLEKAEYVGSRKFAVKELTPGEPKDFWIEMVMNPEAPKEGKKRGLLHFNITLRMYANKEEAENSPAKAALDKKSSKKTGDGQTTGPTSSTKAADDTGDGHGIKHHVKKMTSKIGLGGSSKGGGGNVTSSSDHPDPSQIVGSEDTADDSHDSKVESTGGMGF